MTPVCNGLMMELEEGGWFNWCDSVTANVGDVMSGEVLAATLHAPSLQRRVEDSTSCVSTHSARVFVATAHHSSHINASHFLF